MADSLETTFNNVYAKFKLQFYRRIFARLESREATLSTMESFSVEVIDVMGAPTVTEFAKFLNISIANATYKVQSLIKKGYLRKERSDLDRRESYLYVTERFKEYKKLHTNYARVVLSRIEKSCPPSDVATFKRVLEMMDKELMPEIKIAGS